MRNAVVSGNLWLADFADHTSLISFVHFEETQHMISRMNRFISLCSALVTSLFQLMLPCKHAVVPGLLLL